MGSEIKPLRQFGKFRLDTQKKVLWHEDEPVNLPLKEVELLCALTEQGGEVVTKTELLEKVWADAFVEESNLSRHIYLLRKTFKELGENEELIQTVPRRGYRFAGEIKVGDPGDLIIEKHTLTQTLIEEFPASDSTTRPQALLTRSRLAILGAVIVVIALSSFAFWRYNRATASKVSAVKSIAVLPLKSFAQASEDEALRLRITDALITKLGALNGISVRPTNSVLSFVKEETDALEAGKKLGVEAVLDGRIQTEGENLRVTLQLVSVQTGEQIWSGQFDGKTNEVLNLQDKVAAALLPQLTLSATTEQTAAFAKNLTTNTEAYELYLKGRYLWNHRSLPELRQAVAYFEQAIALDPNFAHAYAGLADTYSMLANNNGIARFEGYAKAKEIAQKALAIAPHLSEAFSALGWILHEHEWNWAEAEKAFVRALELNPNNAEAHHWRGLNFIAQGKTEEFVASMDRARSLAPLTRALSLNYFYVVRRKEGCAKACEYMEGINAHLRSSLRDKANLLGYYFAQCGYYDKALDTLESVPLAELDSRSQASLGVAYAKKGRRQEALQIIERLKKIDGTARFYRMPWVYVALGDFDAAFADLEQALAARDDRLTRLKYDIFLEPLQPDTRFKQLLQKLNLPE
jgi:DNA-binding winged helix-turn-helix (wHTH) protein/TolB-like protein/lipoprotein NlpI